MATIARHDRLHGLRQNSRASEHHHPQRLIGRPTGRYNPRDTQKAHPFAKSLRPAKATNAPHGGESRRLSLRSWRSLSGRHWAPPRPQCWNPSMPSRAHPGTQSPRLRFLLTTSHRCRQKRPTVPQRQAPHPSSPSSPGIGTPGPARVLPTSRPRVGV